MLIRLNNRIYLKLGRRGQNLAEYAVFLAIIILAATAMQPYFKRGLQAFIKDAADDFAYQVDSGRQTTSDPNKQGQFLKSFTTTTVENTDTGEQLLDGGTERTYDDEKTDMGRSYTRSGYLVRD